MTNLEYAKTVVDIDNAVTDVVISSYGLVNGELTSCNYILCRDCEFNRGDGGCSHIAHEWLKQEHKEPVFETFTEWLKHEIVALYDIPDTLVGTAHMHDDIREIILFASLEAADARELTDIDQKAFNNKLKAIYMRECKPKAGD